MKIEVDFIDFSGGFNTDDGIRRAAISRQRTAGARRSPVSIPMTVLGGLQWHELYSESFCRFSFNTDDGIRRAAIA